VDEYFKSMLNMSNYVLVLLKNVPIGSIAEVLRFLELNVKGSSADRHNLMQFLSEVLESGRLVSEYKRRVSELESECSMDLSDETLDLKENPFLCQKLNTCCELAECVKLSELFSIGLRLELSRYRLNCVYNVQSDSLYALIEKSSEMGQFKFLLSCKNLQSLMGENLISYFVNSCQEVTSQVQELVQSCLLLVEKFYLILTVKLNNVLTVAYLKYYWNFIQAKLAQIQSVLPK
jgi:hypothetical protein